MNLLFFVLIGTGLAAVVAWQLFKGIRDQEFAIPSMDPFSSNVRRITMKDNYFAYKWIVCGYAIVILIIAAVMVFGVSVIENLAR